MTNDDLPTGELLEELPVPRKRHGGLIVTAAILVIFGVVIWYVYQRATQPGESGAPPLIKADQGPVKVPPQNPGGMQVPNQDKTIYDRLGNNGDKNASVEKLLPPPEAPKPEAPLPPAGSPGAARAVQAAPLPPPGNPPPGATAAIATPASPAGTPTPPAPSALEKPTPPGAGAPSNMAASQTPAAPASPSSPAPTASSSPPAAAPKTAAIAPKTAPSPAAKPVAVPSTSAAAPGTPRVQLGAFKEVADAEKTWHRLSQKYADLLGGLSPSIIRVDLGAKGIYQRLQVGPLADHAAAVALCEKLKARQQDCLVPR